MGDTCRAVVFIGDGSHETREFPIPEPPDGGAVLQVEAVGLCGSDVAQHEGVHLIPGTSAFPVVPGHETVGRVWRLGRDAALGVSEGDRVAVDEVLSQQPPLAVYGYTTPVDDDGGGLFGGYGEYMVVLPGTRLHVLRDDKPAAELTVFEPDGERGQLGGDRGRAARARPSSSKGPGTRGSRCSRRCSRRAPTWRSSPVPQATASGWTPRAPSAHTR